MEEAYVIEIKQSMTKIWILDDSVVFGIKQAFSAIKASLFIQS